MGQQHYKVEFSHQASAIRGLMELARRVATIPEVRVVREGNSRNSHVRAGSREPRVTVTDRSVRILHQYGGRMQLLFVFPSKGTSLHQIAEKVRRVLDGEDRQGGVGVSSKAPIRIPDHIRRRIEMDARQPSAPPALQSPFPAPAMGVTGEERIPSVADKRILRWHEEAYQQLLGLDPTGNTTRFSIGTLGAALRRFGYHEDEIHALYQSLTKVGFVYVSDEPCGTGRGNGRIAYVFRVTGYHVVDGGKKKRAPSSGTPHTPPQPAVPAESPRKARPTRRGELGVVEALTRFMEDLEPYARQGEKLDCAIKIRGRKITCSMNAAGDTHNIVHRVR